ncbi:unnamed protein product [Boreogadus saida]
MGCDGGTIPKRHELVKGPKKVEKVDKNAELYAKWKCCALTQEKLKRPIITCELGRLYNKDAVIEYLLDKTAERPHADVVSHIRGMKDIQELNFTDNPEWEGEGRISKGDRYEDMHCAMFICPVVGLEMSGKHRAPNTLRLSPGGALLPAAEAPTPRGTNAARHQRREAPTPAAEGPRGGGASAADSGAPALGRQSWATIPFSSMSWFSLFRSIDVEVEDYLSHG